MAGVELAHAVVDPDLKKAISMSFYLVKDNRKTYTMVVMFSYTVLAYLPFVNLG